MRKDLKKLDSEKRYTFVGTFERFGKKNGYKGPLETVLLKDVHLVDNNQILTDHLWFNATKGFKQVGLKPGNQIQFDGRVEIYEKGYFGYREDVYVPQSFDYKICFPTKIINLSRPGLKSKIKRRTKEEIEKAKEQERIAREERERQRLEWEKERETPTEVQLKYIEAMLKCLEYNSLKK